MRNLHRGEAVSRSGRIEHWGSSMSPEAKRDGYRRLAEIPPDTRDNTARLMGDPLPGRRAIDKRDDAA